jgi:putative transposase
MIIRYDPRDLSRVYLLGPDRTYYDLSYRDLRRPPISLWEHRLASKRLREDGRALVDETAIFRTIETMRAIADDAILASKTARRQRERRRRVATPGRSDLLPVEPDEADTFREISEKLQPHERMFTVEEWE